MKKVITKNDIKRMNLTDDELFWMESISEEVNKGTNQAAFDIEHLHSLYSKDATNAYRKAIAYFTCKEVTKGGSMEASLRQTAQVVADIFKASAFTIIRTLKGFDATCQFNIHVSDALGLDHIAIY